MPSLAWNFLGDPSTIGMMALAAGTIAFGSYRSTKLKLFDADEELKESNTIKMKQAILLPIIGSIFLVILFFLMKWIYYILLVLMSFSSLGAISFVFQPYIEWATQRLKIERSKQIRFLGTITTSGCIAFLVAVILVVVWIAVPSSLLLPDILAFCLAISAISVLQLPNLKIAMVILVLFFLYDVFWVFISPFIFQQSVMETVAKSVISTDANPHLPTLPMLIMIPRVLSDGVSILGLGDMVLPGIFLAYLYRLDKAVPKRWFKRYFVTGIIGYVLGLQITLIMLLVLMRGQPALLYLVPCILIPTCVSARIQGEFRLLWNGIPPKQDHLPVTQEQELADPLLDETPQHSA